ncbi:MAG: DNA helicase II [Alphaproteobacteria bacterium]|nr:DNA helicase II [Alphaproteobacteria bacterium]HCQ71357.1 DNA helicase II [Rhodospirillaceae bacterium]|tara:strand:- start:26204 stop:28444 length:2241 start_codon:yes stop_codon:yes gene_type:complete
MNAHSAPIDNQPPYLQGLNPEQGRAVETLDGPVLVLAGAGTGKTRVLTTRLAHLLETGTAFPSQIMAVTFTNKAAQEMKERVSAIMGGMSVEGWWLGTFHALAARILRRHADLVGLNSNFTILDPDDQIRLLKQIMEVHNIDTKKWAPKAMISVIDRWKDRALTAETVDQDEAGDLADGKLRAVYKAYQQRLKEINACDFADLLLHCIHIFKNPENKMILEEYHRRFRYIMVDEYQDTNVAQYLWLRLLAQGSKNICCVGDDDQSIYGWRGAEVGNILRFEQDFPGAAIIRLEQNYRSTNNILRAAGSVIANNSDRLGKELWSEAGDGEKITVMGLWDGDAEARWIGEEIEQMQRKGNALGDMAILVRAGFQTREFEERFIKLGIAYKVIGGQRFYERSEIRDALAYLRATVQPHDDLALERIINKPKRSIGNQSIQKLYAHARRHNMSLHDAIIDLTQTDELTTRLRGSLMRVMDDFNRWRSLLDQMDHAELTAQILEDSGYMAMWKADKSPDAPGRIENLKELVSGMQEFDNMADFLEHVALVFENQQASEEDCVTIMTLHGAKGLEFNTVFLPGWEEGLFPSQRTMDENGLKGLEEERRLAYVGITRARKKAYISYVGNRRMYGNYVASIPSRFIEELPEANIDRASDIGISQSGRSSHWDSSGFGGAHYHSTTKKPTTRSSSLTQQTRSETGDILTRGDRVFHTKFGYGKIINIEGHKLDIKFETSGLKRVMDSFVTKEDCL